MWEELGIAPTKDVRQIRRAYANRLRAIEGDRDGAAFMRLRQAFEAALGWAGRDENRPSRALERSASDRRRERDLAPAQGMAVAVPDEHGAEAETASALADCRRAIAAGDTEAGFRLLQGAFAKGLIPLAEDSEVFAELMALAVADRSLAAERFRDMARFGNWHLAPVHWDELRDQVMMRLAAEAWYDGLVAAASCRMPWFFGFSWKSQRYWRRRLAERSDARLLLDRSWRWSYYFLQAAEPGIERLLAHYELYEPWVAHRVHGKRLVWLRKMMAMPRWKFRLVAGFMAAFIIVAAAAPIILIAMALMEG